MKFVKIGKIFAVHGVQGAVKVQSLFHDPDRLIEFDSFFSSDGSKEFKVIKISKHKKFFITYFKEINDRNQAEELINTELYIDKSYINQLEEDEYLYDDLIGLDVIENNKKIGKILMMYDINGSDIIEILYDDNNKTDMIIFSKETVTEVNIKKGYITVNLSDINVINERDFEN